jgi:hypothetical protein
MKYILLFCFAVILFTGCDSNDDIVKVPNKDGAIETSLTVKHASGYDLLITTHKVWVKNQLDKTIITMDTLKSLGTTLEEGEDKDGNTSNVSVPKDYEFYITVK